MKKLFLSVWLLCCAAPAFATFPTVAATNSGNSAASNTGITVNMPTGFANGDLGIACVSWDGDPGAQTWPSGGSEWTSLFSTACNSTACTVACRYRVATAPEASFSLSWANSEGSSYVTYRIEGHNSSTTAPQVGTTAAPTASANPDPPTSASPSGGTLDYLFIVVYGWDGNNSHTTYPTNYSSNQVTDRWANANGSGIAIATRNLNTGSTENPGTATISGSDQWAANTLIVHPGSEGTGGLLGPLVGPGGLAGVGGGLVGPGGLVR